MSVGDVEHDAKTFTDTLRPGQQGGAVGQGDLASADKSAASVVPEAADGGGAAAVAAAAPDHDDGNGEAELDPRAAALKVEPMYLDLPAEDLRVITGVALRAYNAYVLVPTSTTWRKEEGARRELERDVERTAMSDIAEEIKKEVCARLGGSWHVVYGRDFATYVTHKRRSFCHFQLDGADVVVWRHGG